MRRILVMVAVAAIAVAAACGGGKEEAATPAGQKALRFAVIPKALDIPVFNYAKIGAERAAKELGNVQIEWRASETADQLRQKEILESFITQRVDGISI
jgi:ABC-type sugar transport system substrate-binding protein